MTEGRGRMPRRRLHRRRHVDLLRVSSAQCCH
ncbi:putative leader peptide [Luteipulveratus mongoliensis]